MKVAIVVPVHIVRLYNTADDHIECPFVKANCWGPNASRFATNVHNIGRQIELRVPSDHIADLSPVYKILGCIYWNARECEKGGGNKIKNAVYVADRRIRIEARN